MKAPQWARWPRDKGHSCGVPTMRPITNVGDEASCPLCGRIWHIVPGPPWKESPFWQSKAEGPARQAPSVDQEKK